MKIIHSGVTYECNVAVKCENDKYIKLYDANGAEIASFNNISDFSDYSVIDGSFVAPCDCKMPISAATYFIGGRTIKSSDWKSVSGQYQYEITSDLITGNATTCDILLSFADGTDFTYKATQQDGKVVLSTTYKPVVDIVISGIQITKAK